MYYYHIHDLWRIRRYSPLSVTKIIATALVSSRPDYCNYLLFQIIAFQDLTLLQRVENCLGRVLTRSPVILSRCSAYIFPALNPFRLTFLRMRESDACLSCYAGCLRFPPRGTHR